MINSTDEPHRRALMAFLEQSGVPFRRLSHLPCRSSTESAAARTAAGAPGSVGAKALIIRTSEPVSFALLVIPGDYRLRNDSVRKLIGKFRFASAEEIRHVTNGLEPGMIPPFTRPIFPTIETLIVDENIPLQPLLGFNASHLCHSVVMNGADYIAIAGSPRVAPISILPGSR